jgi:ribosomal protein S27AE
MGSVISEETCPECGYLATFDYNYKSGEHYMFCGRCGYIETNTIINMEDRSQKNWKPKYKYDKIKCLGHFRYGDNVFSSGGFREEKDIIDFEKYIKKNKDKLRVGEYTFKKNDEWFVKDLVNDTITKLSDKEFVEEL